MRPAVPARKGTLFALDARVLRALPMTCAGASWPTAAEVAARLGVAVDVAASWLRRLSARELAEHDGERPRRFARTARVERALEWES